MLEISPAARPPLFTLLVLLLPLVIAGGLALRAVPRSRRARLALGALLLGAGLTAASAACWSRRHAGTGTETARGWPRTVHAQWVPFDDGTRRAGIQWRGVIENATVYTAASLLVLALLARHRHAGAGPVERT